MIPILLSLLLACQDGELDRLLLRFQQRREKVQSEAEFRRLLADSRLELQNWVRDNPNHKDLPRARFQIAETYLATQEYDAALPALQAFIASHPDAPDAPSARFAIAEILHEKEKDEEARKAFDDFVKRYPADDRTIFARMYAAITMQNEKRYDEAAELLLAVRQDFKTRRESWGAMLQLAIVRHVQEKNGEARKILEELIRDCPDKEPVELARRHLLEFLKLGKPAPGFSEKDLEGRDQSLDKLAGKVVVVYFFEPLTPSAAVEATFLRKAREEAARAGRADDLQIIGVSIGTDRKEMPMYKAQAKCDWTLLFDGKGIDGKVPRAFDVRGLPSLTVIDRKGLVRFYNIAGRDFRNSVAKLLEEK